ncbi:MAG: ribonuclease, partial [Actinomycetota bacterium]|nr:ribonuclease [Actinomycetota bacterium]
GISRKLPENERTRLKAILKKVVPEDAGVIIRTAAEGASEEELAADVRRLQAQWEVIKTKGARGGAPVLLHAEPDLLIRVVRDIFNEDFAQLVVAGDNEWDTIRDYVEFVAPDLASRLKKYDGSDDVFAAYRIDEQLAKALDRKVWLPSGGSLVIDRTEAMVVVDVNTGKYVGKGGNLEETVTRNNLEAAEEIARQLRLRDLGGIIVVDFIDMVLESNRDLVVRRLVECLGRDRTKHQVAEVTSLGLVQMTRKRVGQGLLEAFSEPCETCGGRGVIVHSEPVDEKKQARNERFDDRPRSERGGRDRAGRGDDKPREDKPREDKPAATSEDGDSAAPRKRSRGGRGRGGRSEGAAEPSVDSIPAEDQVPYPDAPPEIAEQPPTELEDQPVVPEPGAEATPEPAAGPKRRRRATSRPAGPPTVTV